MQQRCCFSFAFLCSLLFPPLARSSQCAATQYSWISGSQQRCCDMCLPGHFLVQRCGRDSATQCKPCDEGRYIHNHNEEFGCNFCDKCNHWSTGLICGVGLLNSYQIIANLEYRSHCNSTHNAVCKCKSGYKCADQNCKECLPLPTTTAKPTPTPFRTAVPPHTVHTETTTRDSLCLLMTLLLVTSAVILLIKLPSALLSITSKCGYLLANPKEPVSTCSEDEEVTKPIQEAGNVTKIKMDP